MRVVIAVARGVTLYRKRKHRECRVRVIICPVREIVQVVISTGVDEDNRNYQLRFCKTEISRKSDEIGSIYQSKSESPLIADKGDEEGVCYFLRSRLPTTQGTVNGKKVIALRDTGCTGCVVRRSLVSSDQLLGKESDVTLIDESTQRYPLAMVEIDCPFFTGKTEALCMDDTLYHYMTLLLEITIKIVFLF